MHRITLDTEAGQVSAELARRGIAAGSRVHVLVEVVDEDTADALPMAAIAQTGGAFGWLADKPDLYTDADLWCIRHRGRPVRCSPFSAAVYARAFWGCAGSRAVIRRC